MKRKISVGACIQITFCTVLVLMFAICLVSYIDENASVKKGTQLYENYGNVQGEAGMALAYFQEVKCDLRNALYLYADDADKQAEALESIETARDNLSEMTQAAMENVIDGEAADLLDKAQTYIDAYLADVDACVAYVEAGDIDAARDYLLNNGVDSAIAAVDTFESFVDRLDEAALDEEEVLEHVMFRSEVINIVMLVISILSCISGMVLLSGQVKKPLVSLAQAANRLAVGDVRIELPKEVVLREVDVLIEAFDAMTKNLQNQAQAMQQLAEGNLQAEITAHSPNDAVGTALEKLIADDNTVFHTIRNAADQISLGSNQIAAASQTLAQGSTEQASAIEQIAASISDIAGKTRDNAEQANEVNRDIIKAKDDVDDSNARMKEMVAAMEEINEASENIQKIIKVIDDIAFNTNILALNAAVEAARAGEQGKGFAVVAEEVRNLAGRSAEASSQTAEMIEDSIQKVKRGAELAKDTASSLQAVSELVEDITGLCENIAKASNDQASATAQIDQALTQVSQVVQTNSATSQQCASASEELSGQARGLNRELSKFRLKDIVGGMSGRTLEYAEPELLGEDMKY